MKKLGEVVRKFILTALFMCLFTVTSFAADIHNMKAQYVGMNNIEEMFPYGFITLYEQHFLNVPDYLVEYYNKLGGIFTFTTEDLNKGQFGNRNILGLYHKDTHNIEVKITPCEVLMQDTVMYSAPAHEFGHFLYNTTKDVWDEDMYDSLKEEFEKRCKTNNACVNIDETFAYAYADYVITPWHVNPKLIDTIQKSLDIIKVRNGGGVDTWVDIYPNPNTLTEPGTVVYK